MPAILESETSMESIIKNTPASQHPTFTVTEKIGHTTYEARAFCLADGKDTFEEKFLRVIHHAALDFFGTHGIMNIPQTSRQSERSA